MPQFTFFEEADRFCKDIEKKEQQNPKYRYRLGDSLIRITKIDKNSVKEDKLNDEKLAKKEEEEAKLFE